MPLRFNIPYQNANEMKTKLTDIILKSFKFVFHILVITEIMLNENICRSEITRFRPNF